MKNIEETAEATAKATTRNDQYSKEEYNELINSENAEIAEGVLEILPDGFGFLRGENYQTTENDVYISPAQIRRFNMKTGDKVTGVTRAPKNNERFKAILFVKAINGIKPEVAAKRKDFDRLTPIYPHERLILENGRDNIAPRIIDLLAPIGKGQRGIIVAPPKAGKTSLLKNIANSIKINNPDVELIVLLVDERPEEVTDIKESVAADVVASTFDQEPYNHIKVAEMVLSRAKSLVEHGVDVVILMDSITRLARAYNLTISPTGRTLSGGLDPGALYGPKKFFGSARCMREGGSLTIIATALVDTGSRMDDVIFEEFKGTGNMELILDRKLAERRVYPAIDIYRSGTRKEELLLSKTELETVDLLRRYFGSKQLQETAEQIIEVMRNTKTNKQFLTAVSKSIKL